MKLVLFGAGASVDAGLGASPPLTSSLFSELKIFAPHSWGTLTEEEQQLFQDDYFEKGMEELLGAPLNLNNGDVFELKFPLSPRKQLLCDLQWDMAIFFSASCSNMTIFMKSFLLAPSTRVGRLNTLP